MDFRPPDLHGPRYRYKRYVTGSVNFIKRFKKKYPQYAHYPKDALIKAIKAHHIKICNEIINSREGVELQGSMGNMYICMANSYKKKPIAFGKSAKLGMKVYHNNHETDGKIAKIKYTNYGVRTMFENRRLWHFTGIRRFTREVAHTCPKLWRQYILMEDIKGIVMNRDKQLLKYNCRKRQDQDMITYNEFDLD